MPAMTLLPALLLVVTAASPEAPLRLEALASTSGAGVERILDGDPTTTWSPEGDPRDEGILLRFGETVKADGVEVVTCAGASRFTAFADGFELGLYEYQEKKGAHAAIWAEMGPDEFDELRSLFLRVDSGTGCIAELSFLKDGKPLPVSPPRQVAGRLTATSTLPPAPAYHASYLFDGRLDFGWVEGAAGSGAGEGVTIELEKPVTLTGLEVWNGYQRSEAHFTRNARARGVTVSLDGRPPIPLELRDEQGSRIHLLPAGPPAKRITLRVTSAYPGLKYPDLVLSELRLWDAEGALRVATSDREAMKRALLEQAKPTILAAFMDRKLQAWETPKLPAQSLKLRSDHTFVAYQSCSSRARCLREAMDGTWVLSGSDAGSAEIELFARAHRTDENTDPYAPGGAYQRESTRIAGGKLRITVPAPGSVKVSGKLLDRELKVADR
ncbi:MAG: hypothetical protein QM767_20590 [Anaeromyxobacter sp.]